jgi:hypothetical protein
MAKSSVALTKRWNGTLIESIDYQPKTAIGALLVKHFPDRLYCLPCRYRFFKTAKRVAVINDPPDSNLKLNIDNSQGMS